MTIQHKQNELGIYIHIPFCVQKCAYCDFLSAPADESTRERYVSALVREIEAFSSKAENYEVVSVFLGGGTPSILTSDQLKRILGAVEKTFHREQRDLVPDETSDGSQTRISKYASHPARRDKNAGGAPDISMSTPEITVECNPGTLTKEKLAALKEMGVNRLSIGLQSTENELLARLGRIHTWEVFLENYELARSLGFDNINIDLMSALPGQSVKVWEETLQKVLALKPEHISAYSLIIEEGTPFYERYEDQVLDLPSEEEERQMYLLTEERLLQQGMYRYEISNYAKPGYESLHNSGYWLRRDYIGFGLGASSMLGNVRFKNTDVLADYLDGITVEEESVQQLTKEEQMEETMFLGLRMMRGVSEAAFAQTYGSQMEEVYKDVLEKMQQQGLMERAEGYWRLTPRGIDVSNVVMAEFLLD